MGVGETSRRAYDEIRRTLGRRQLEVLDVIERHPAGITNNEIAHELHWPINCVTPRVFELRSAGLVALVGKRPDAWTRKVSMLWARVKGVQLEFEAFRSTQEREVDCESPRFQLCQRLVDLLRLQNGTITILVKNGRVLKAMPQPAVDFDEPEVMESLQLGPAPSDS